MKIFTLGVGSLAHIFEFFCPIPRLFPGLGGGGAGIYFDWCIRQIFRICSVTHLRVTSLNKPDEDWY